MKNIGGSFKPCYKWNTFNTYTEDLDRLNQNEVLNLVINGIPSILNESPEKDSYLVREQF